MLEATPEGRATAARAARQGPEPAPRQATRGAAGHPLPAAAPRDGDDGGNRGRAGWGWLAGLTLLLVACASGDPPGPRQRPSGLATPMPSADFAAYVVAAAAQVEAANAALGLPPPGADVVADRAPFELTPPARCAKAADGRAGRAVLLIHDLGGSPYVLRDLGGRLADSCHLVRAILLPGHGTIPGDLLEVERATWREAVRLGVAGLALEAHEVDLVGFAEGAGLALDYVTYETPPEGLTIGALVLLAPALAPRGDPLLAPAYEAYGALVPGAAWPELRPDLDPLRYDSLPRHADSEMDRLLGGLIEAGPPLELPVLVAVSADDLAIDAGAVKRWFCRRLVGPRALIWYTTDPAPSTDCRFIGARRLPPEPGVLDLAHPGLPVAPGNPRHGRETTNYDCRHYYANNSPDYLLCADPSKTPANANIRYGEITPANLERHIVRRLTYNPDFDRLTIDILAFLAHLPPPATRPTAKPPTP